MALPVGVILIVILSLILVGVLLYMLWGMITGVHRVRMIALAITNFIGLFSPLIGQALSDFVKAFVWV